ncbi:hypothetical protein N7540_002250 [Penicillium herquei]|nr:hypothetical protein N7540_002250 [Penicillium herquei]
MCTQLFAAFMHSFFKANPNINGRDDSLYFLMAHFPAIAGQSEVLDRSIMSLAFCILNTDYGSQEDWDCLTTGRTESPNNEQFGMVADCACLQRDFIASLNLSGPTRRMALKALWQRCLQLEQVQADWYSRNDIGFNHQLHGDLQFSAGFDPSPHEYKSLETAKIYMLFFINLLLAHRAMSKIQGCLTGYSDTTKVLSSAQEICQTVAYCIKPERLSSSGHVVLFGISQATKGYIDCGDFEKFKWCQNIYSIIHSGGLGMAQHQGERDWNLWHHVQNQRASASQSGLVLESSIL